MRTRYVLAPEAAHDLVMALYQETKQPSDGGPRGVGGSGQDRFSRVRTRVRALAQRKDLTHEGVKFFPVYSYLIVYRPKTRPLQVVSILHSHRDVEGILKNRWRE